jgi:hypothetical protein
VESAFRRTASTPLRQQLDKLQVGIVTVLTATLLGVAACTTSASPTSSTTTSPLNCGSGTHQVYNACVPNSSTTLPDPDGNWSVTAHVTGCFTATGTNTIAVSNGRFTNSKIFSYKVNGATETVTISGTIERGRTSLTVSGNEFLTGNDCNGGNGFSGFLETMGASTTGTAASAWGTLHFTKQ